MAQDGIDELTKPRHRQIESNNYFRTLLNSLTLEGIRESVFRLAPERKISVKRLSEAEAALLKIGASMQDVEATLLDVEARHPFKHCLLLRLESQKLLSLTELQKLVGTRFVGLADIDFRLARVTQTENLSLTFEHSVEVKEWVDIDKETRKKRVFQTRQPIVVRVQPSNGILTINYPGISHAGADAGPSGYEAVVESLISVLTKNFNIDLKTLPLRETLSLFLEGPNNRVLRVKADVDSPLARLDMSSKGQSGNIEEALSSFISAHLTGVDKSLITNAAKRAFNNATLNSVVLYWLEEGLFTRLKFWSAGTELYFVWNKETPSYRTIDNITSLLSSAHELTQSSETATPIEWVAQQPPLTIISPAELAATYSLKPGVSRSILMKGMQAGLLQAVYRVKTTDLISDIRNDWSTNLQNLKRVLTTDSGQLIDGSDPKNIEVAFQRIASINPEGSA